MYPSECKSVRATSLEEATSLLEEYGSAAHVLAGGQSLVPLMKQRLATPETLIDISHIEPEPIAATDGTFEIPALTTHGEVGNHRRLTDAVDVVADAVPLIGDHQVRNMGTVGGALAEADPANDWGPILVATDGTVRTIATDGRRSYDAAAFFEGPFATKMDHAELIESVSVPVPDGPTGGAYIKAKRRQGVYGTAAVGVRCTLDDANRIDSVGIAAVDDATAYVTPTDVEARLRGREPTDDLVTESAEAMRGELNPVGDSRGSESYKRALGEAIFERALKTAVCRANGVAVPDPKKVDRQWSELDV